MKNKLNNIFEHFKSDVRNCYEYENISYQCLLSMQKEAEQQIIDLMLKQVPEIKKPKTVWIKTDINIGHNKCRERTIENINKLKGG